MSAEEGTATLYVSRFSNWHSLKKTEWTKTAEQQVTATTIDQVASEASRPIAMIRMDIEGYEAAVIRGACQTLSTQKPRLIIEVHPAQFSNRKDLTAMLEGLASYGYIIQFLI